MFSVSSKIVLINIQNFERIDCRNHLAFYLIFSRITGLFVATESRLVRTLWQNRSQWTPRRSWAWDRSPKLEFTMPKFRNCRLLELMKEAPLQKRVGRLYLNLSISSCWACSLFEKAHMRCFRKKDEVQGLMDKILYQRALDSMEQAVSTMESRPRSPKPPKFPDTVSSCLFFLSPAAKTSYS